MSGESENPVVVAHPIDTAVLADYWVAALSDADEAAVETHLFECDQCGGLLREIIELAEGIRRLAREGSLRVVVSEAFVECAKAEGLRVREYAPHRGGSVQCTVTAEDDLLIGRLSADFVGATRVDLCLCDRDGSEQVRLPDIPVHAKTGHVIYQESITFAKGLPTTSLVARLVAVERTGDERLIGEYTFNHARSLPGPGAFGPA